MRKGKPRPKKPYYEWMPIRESDKHYRKFSFGKRVDLFMLDERLEGRVEPVEGADDPSITSGQENHAWRGTIGLALERS